MFSNGFQKIAATMVTQTPEEYYEHLGAKDKYVGALAGNLAGAAIGLAKGQPNRKAEAAVAGALIGTAAGTGLGYGVGKVYRGYQAGKVHRMAGELNLKTSPSRRAYSNPGES